MILSYAFAKILGTQFTSQPSVYDKPIGILSGFELTWFFYGYSYWYGVFIASSQILSSLLLFFRKTTRLGIILFLSIMANIVALDFAYDIQGAKGMSVILTLMAIFVFLSDFPNFYKYFIVNEPLFQDSERPNWVNKYSKIKFVYIPIVFIAFFVLISTMKEKYMHKNKLYGTWQCLNQSSEIDKLNFEFNNSFSVFNKCENKQNKSGQYEIKNDVLQLNAFKSENEEQINKSVNVLDFDKSKTIVFIKGKFTLKNNNLEIIEENTIYKFKRIR
jgi:hypothetical protein